MNEPQKILWYFADPMCSWCWGFAPVISAIRAAYSDRLRIALMLGGLRPGTREALTPAGREEILHHWQAVHQRTQQPFVFEGAMPSGFVYDTEPPSRAVIAVADIRPDILFDYFHSVQEAFYAHGRDVTQVATLEDLAVRQAIDPASFRKLFDSERLRDKTQVHFQIARQSGVQGFPTVVLQQDEHATLLTHGYRPLDELLPHIDTWLANAG